MNVGPNNHLIVGVGSPFSGVVTSNVQPGYMDQQGSWIVVPSPYTLPAQLPNGTGVITSITYPNPSHSHTHSQSGPGSAPPIFSAADPLEQSSDSVYAQAHKKWFKSLWK